jgi:peptide/nickel transport system permease protein
MLVYLARRLVQTVPVLLIISFIVFMIMHLLPGDPAMLMLGGEYAVSAEHVQELRAEMGLDDPIYVQYARFLAGAIRGDLGTSARFKRPVTEVVLEQFPFTLQLAAAGMVVAVVIGLGIGITAAVVQHSWVDTIGMLIALFGTSTPIFWVGLMLIFVFAFQLGWLPATGAGGWKAIILPALTVGLIGAGSIARIARATFIEVLCQDYIRVARSKGLGEAAVISGHALKNAMIPIVTIMGLQFGGMLSGAVITETVFSRPGIGRLVVGAILWKDFRLAQGIILLAAVSYMLVNLVIDISYAWLDPRVRYGEQR